MEDSVDEGQIVPGRGLEPLLTGPKPAVLPIERSRKDPFTVSDFKFLEMSR